MRVHVCHTTVYEYDAPMRFVTQSHRLTPSSCASQRVIDWSVTAEGAAFGASFVDGAGDRISTMTVEGPVERLEIRVEGIVETTDTAGVLRNHREVISPRAYLQPTASISPNGALLSLAAQALAGSDRGDGLSCAHRLSTAVSDAIRYAPGSTDALTTAAEALERGSGVCQDHTHALIALAHATDMPARYVTGYLLVRDDGTPEEASHAWAEIHVGSLGWVGFDAANRASPDARYVRIGSGRDAAEAALIRGVSRGRGVEAMDVEVLVEAMQQ